MQRTHCHQLAQRGEQCSTSSTAELAYVEPSGQRTLCQVTLLLDIYDGEECSAAPAQQQFLAPQLSAASDGTAPSGPAVPAAYLCRRFKRASRGAMPACLQYPSLTLNGVVIDTGRQPIEPHQSRAPDSDPDPLDRGDDPCSPLLGNARQDHV